MAVAEKYIREGHPTIEELIVEQHADFPRDPHELLGDFWPEDFGAREKLPSSARLK
jgi:hypothetical protein